MSGKIINTPSAENLAASVNAASKSKGLPPVHLWNPPFCGDLDIRIARDGTWFYLGTPIGRPALVKLFSSILKQEDGKYYLVTPVEKVGIVEPTSSQQKGRDFQWCYCALFLHAWPMPVVRHHQSDTVIMPSDQLF